MIKYLSVTISIVVAFLGTNARAQTSHLSIGDSLYALGNYAAAINAYARSGGAQAGLQIARSYRAMGNADKAIIQYTQVSEDHPEMPIARFELGKLLLSADRFNEASECFSGLIGQNPDNPEYHYFLGEVFRNLHQWDSSLVSYKKAVSLDSTHLRSLFQLGKYFTAKQERDQALKYIDQGLRFYDNDVALINLKALVYYNDSQYNKAIIWFEKVLELGEHKEFIYEKLAFSYYKEWEFEKAKKAYVELLKFNDSEPEYYYKFAEAYRKNQQLDSAQLMIEKGIAVQRPSIAEGYMALSLLARQREDLKTALFYLEKATKEDPGNAMAYFRFCNLADRLYEDPKVKLKCFEEYMERFVTANPYFTEMAKNRISSLKQQIHYGKE